ncbi:glycosyltransferase family 4 protein [Chitinophaga vietnamensis]|uniref:glycosyltransferase family 4 protein n=1 Tax=Chitinophaga vietnamensis TaxID=2593957 RepID=UPI001177B3B4|nr:glycosyltransferase family 4 protein [Chitinophaga vietnamensis]
MRILLLYDYPPSPGGLSTQGDLLYKGLLETGIDVHAVHTGSHLEKEWYYRWFKPDVVTGIGYWGHVPEIALHPQRHGMLAVPWLVADGFIASYQQELNELPLLLVTSGWVKEMYQRDGITSGNIEVLPVGCNTDAFHPFPQHDEKINTLRQMMGIRGDELMILTVGGDAASKGAREVMRALAQLGDEVPPWKYVCKVWKQDRTERQNKEDLKLASELGIADRIIFKMEQISRNAMPYLIGACDIYAAPSRLEGFGMPLVEAGACGKPVVSMKAMGMLDTLVHGETALLAGVDKHITIHEAVGARAEKVVFDVPRTVEYRAKVDDLATHLRQLLSSELLRYNLGRAARKHVREHFDYRIVARQFVQLLRERFDL